MDNNILFSDIQQESPESQSKKEGWSPICVESARDNYLERLGSLPALSQTVLGQDLGYASVQQRCVYYERSSYLESLRENCVAWLTEVQLQTVVPNTLSKALETVLVDIHGHVQGLELWLGRLPEHDRKDLTGEKKPDRPDNCFETLSAPEKEKWLGYARQRYMLHRGDIIDPKMVEEMKDEPKDQPTLLDVYHLMTHVPDVQASRDGGS